MATISGIYTKSVYTSTVLPTGIYIPKLKNFFKVLGIKFLKCLV